MFKPVNENDINSQTQKIYEWVAPRSDNNDLIVTLCTNGYTDYALNLMWYLKTLGLERMVCVFCTDHFCYKVLTSYGINTFLFSATWVPSIKKEQVLYKSAGWREIVATKLEVVYSLLHLGFNVIWTDGDVVWLKDPLQNLRKEIVGCELAYQITSLVPDGTDWNKETQTWNGSAPLDYTKTYLAPKPNMCAGFYYARSCSKTQDLFNPERIDPSTFLLEEHHLNPLLRTDGIRVSMLNPKQYPNGKLWMSPNNKVTDPYIIHYNYVSGGEKIAKMKYYGHWKKDQLLLSHAKITQF